MSDCYRILLGLLSPGHSFAIMDRSDVNEKFLMKMGGLFIHWSEMDCIWLYFGWILEFFSVSEAFINKGGYARLALGI